MANQPTKYSKFLVGAASAALVATAVAPVASAADFKDTKGNTHEEAINALSAAGVISGYADGTFKPNKTLTRSDVVKMMGKWLVSEGYKVPTDYKTNVRFTDLKSTSNDELLQYAAVVKDNGVFIGSNDRLLAGDDISRENMAVVIVRAFDRVHDIDLASYVAGQDFKKDVTDLGKAKAEARPAIDVLDFFDITNPAAPAFNPKATTTRGQFASFLNKTLTADFSKVTGQVAEGVASVKAVNATTVEVTMKDSVSAENLNSLHFKIDGLTVSNAAVKQTDDKVVVLTTAVQKGGEKYTVTLNEKAIGSFTGVSGVVPTSIKMTQSFNQAKVGKQVILTADIGVKEAGVPVTFNIDAPSGSLNKDIIVEVSTNAEGLATYSYTQYAAGTDIVSVYPTGAPTTRSVANVYWGIDEILTVTESATGAAINGTTRTYDVVLRNPVNGLPLANQSVNVTFKENVDSINGTTAVLADPRTGGNAVSPFQSATNERTFAVTTDANGKAVFTVTGANTKATPVVFLDSASVGLGIGGNANGRWEAGELQAVLPTVEFKGAQSAYTFDFGEMKHAEFATGLGNFRTYTATVKKADGTVYANGAVKVGLEEILDNNLSTTTSVVFTSATGTNLGQTVQSLQTNAEGKVTFRIAEPTGTASNVTGTPAIWIDLDAAGNTNSVRETGEPQALAPSTTFQAALAASSALTVTSQPTEGPHVTGDAVNVRFQLRNQSGTLSTTAGFNRVNYTLTNTTGGTVTINPSLTDATTGSAFTNMTTTFAGTNTTAFTNGSPITLNAGSSVTISGTAAGYSTQTSVNPDTSSTNSALLSFAAANQANTMDISASGTAVRANVTSDARNVTSVSQAAKSVSVVTSTVAQNGTTYAGKVIGFTTADNTAAGTYGRVVVQLDNGSNIVVPYKVADTVRIGTDGNFAGTFTNSTFDQFENKLAVDNRLKVVYATPGASTIDLANVKNIGSTGNADGNTAATPGVGAGSLTNARSVASAIELTFDKAINDSAVGTSAAVLAATSNATLTAAGITFTGLPAGVTVTGVTTGTANDTGIVIALSRTLTAAEAAAVTVSVNPNSVRFMDGTFNAVTTSKAVVDASPVAVTSAMSEDVGNTGVTNKLTLTFNKNIDKSAINANLITGTAGNIWTSSVDTVATAAAPANTIVLNVTGVTSGTGVLTAANIQAGAVKEAGTAALNTAVATQAIVDNARPVALTAKLPTAGVAGLWETTEVLTVTFSENILGLDTTGAILPAAYVASFGATAPEFRFAAPTTAFPVTSVTVAASTNTVTFTALGTATTNIANTAVDVVNGSLLDAAGNTVVGKTLTITN